MSDELPTAISPEIRSAQRWNIVWVLPIIALLIGGWMLYRHHSVKGMEIRLRFETADGLIIGKTELRCRSVSIGKVSKIELAEDLNSVLVFCSIENEYEDLIRSGSRFWVVRPRVSAADISGLGTLITGVYIEMQPGKGAKGVTKWKGRETPPATNATVPGLRLSLFNGEAGSLSVGAPVYFRGYEVGRIESRELSKDGLRITYEAFVKDKYRSLVRENTKFWNTTGIDISAGADGFKVRTPSLQALVSGGVSFGNMEGVQPGLPAKDGASFFLNDGYEEAVSSTFNPTLQLLLLFDQSVRGLAKSAPVEYRGIQIGRVTNISFDYLPNGSNRKVPVLCEIDPNILQGLGAANTREEGVDLLGNSVKNGLRASLKTGSLLTGAMYVDFDFYPQEKADELSFQSDFPIVPTISSGFAQLEVKLSSILDKINELPLNQAMTQITSAAEETAKTVAEAREAISEVEALAASLKETIEAEDVKKLPSEIRSVLSELDKTLESVGPSGNIQGDLLRTLDELRAALRSVDGLADALKEDPNALLFGKDKNKTLKPKAFEGQ